MCKHHFAYLECPLCSVLHRPIDILEPCATAPAPPDWLTFRDAPSGLLYHTHGGTDHTATAFTRWHFATGAALPPPSRLLAFRDADSLCDRCLWRMVTEAGGAGRGPGGGHHRRATAEARRASRDLKWPSRVGSGGAAGKSRCRDDRIFRMGVVEWVMGEPRALGGLEVCRRAAVHAPGKWVRRRFGRWLGELKMPSGSKLSVLQGLTEPRPWGQSI
ncbi:hypothetical protein P8C59_004591 [Phyllachora maydis]|uniref:Uncharacterized protein n=1 Tax=Phyllachora maydis TaxID=1825666 RepID=A0AAD9I2J9_9PEZI|nr:hypothetical protein P8C59_004591 [Phyllachora maydis]